MKLRNFDQSNDDDLASPCQRDSIVSAAADQDRMSVVVYNKVETDFADVDPACNVLNVTG